MAIPRSTYFALRLNKMRYLFAFMLCGVALFSAPAGVLGVTPTQAILSYTAPDLLACTISVLDPYGNLIHDVDSSLFTSANSDSRSIVSGKQQRIVVIGKRAADLSLDGFTRYSRALEAGEPTPIPSLVRAPSRSPAVLRPRNRLSAIRITSAYRLIHRLPDNTHGRQLI